MDFALGRSIRSGRIIRFGDVFAVLCHEIAVCVLINTTVVIVWTIVRTVVALYRVFTAVPIHVGELVLNRAGAKCVLVHHPVEARRKVPVHVHGIIVVVFRLLMK